MDKSGAGKTYCHANSLFAFGYFRSRAYGMSHKTVDTVHFFNGPFGFGPGKDSGHALRLCGTNGD